MIGQLYINGKDAWLTWGVVLESESINSLRKPADNKGYTKNQFRSQHGDQLFICNPRKESRDVLLVFSLKADSEEKLEKNYDDFISELDNGLVVFSLPKKGKTHTFITNGYQELNYLGAMCKLSVRFNESFSLPVVFDVLGTEMKDAILTEDGKTILI